MEKGSTTDPRTALSGLIAMALVGILVIGGGMAVSGLVSSSWLQVVAGVAFLTGFSWLALEAGKVVREALRGTSGKQDAS
jgi:hypothetical protein